MDDKPPQKRKRGRPRKNNTNLQSTTPPSQKKQKRKISSPIKTLAAAMLPRAKTPTSNKKKTPSPTPQPDNNVEKTSKPNIRLTRLLKESTINTIHPPTQQTIIQLPLVNIYHGTPYWLSARALGLSEDTSIRVFYHGQHLFAVQDLSYERAQRIFQVLFKPVTTFFLCNYCKQYCPNMFVLNAHRIFFSQNKICPIDNQLETSSLTPAFYIPRKIIDFFQAFLDEKPSKYISLPLDLLNGAAEYQNFFNDNNIQQTPRQTMLQKEELFIQKGYDNHHFVILLEAALLTFESKDNSYDPPILSVPYFSVQKIKIFLKKYKQKLPQYDLEKINIRLNKFLNLNQPEMPMFSV